MSNEEMMTETADELRGYFERYEAAMEFWKVRRNDAVGVQVLKFHRGQGFDKADGERLAAWKKGYLVRMNVSRGLRKGGWEYFCSRDAHYAARDAGYADGSHDDLFLGLFWKRLKDGAMEKHFLASGGRASLRGSFRQLFDEWIDEGKVLGKVEEGFVVPDREELHRYYLGMLANTLTGYVAEARVVDVLLPEFSETEFADRSFEKKDVDVVCSGLYLSVKSGSSFTTGEFDKYRGWGKTLPKAYVFVGKDRILQMYVLGDVVDGVQEYLFVSGCGAFDVLRVMARGGSDAEVRVAVRRAVDAAGLMMLKKFKLS